MFYPDESEQGTVADPTVGDDGPMPGEIGVAGELADQPEPGSPVHAIPPLGGQGDVSPPHTPFGGLNGGNVIQWATPPTGGEVDSEGVPPRYRTLPDLLESTEQLQLEYNGVCLVAAEEPSTVDQALTELCWRNAMKAEGRQLRQIKLGRSVIFRGTTKQSG